MNPFDTRTTDGSQDPTPGEYTVRCISARTATRKTGDEALVIDWKILVGPCAGATVSDWLDFSSEKEIVVQISEDRIYGIAQAMGRDSIDRSDEIVGTVARVVLKERTWGTGQSSISPSYYKPAPKEALVPVSDETKAKLFAAVNKAHGDGRIDDVREFGKQILERYGAKDSSDLQEIAALDAIAVAENFRPVV